MARRWPGGDGVARTRRRQHALRRHVLDPVSYGLTARVLLTLCAIACYIPARRATTVEPLIPLRAE